MIAVDFDDMQTLVRMSERGDNFVGKIAKGLLDVVESRRDAEIRAATAEAALATERGKLAAIRELLVSLPQDQAAQSDVLRQVAMLVA